jgi:hypothetical protein
MQSTVDPFAVSAPRAVVQGWASFTGLPPSAFGSIPISCPDAAVSPGRVDILRRDGKRWTWITTFQYGPSAAIQPAGFDRGVLVRFEGSSTYLWSEVQAHASTPIVIRRFKNVSIDSAPGATLSLYVASERTPRTVVDDRFHFVPLEAALACATTGSESRCSELGPQSTHTALSFASGDDARVLRVEPQEDDAFRVIAKGNVAIRPKVAGRSIAQVSPWVAIGLQQKGLSWSDALIDRTGREFALERLRGSALLPPPGFAEVPSRHDRGLLLRPYVGPQRAPLSDPFALLLVSLTADATLASEIPLLTSPPQPDGNFHLPALASGTYVLKLLSSSASPETLTVSAMAGVPLDVVFRGGPTVRGRIVRASGGSPSDPVTIEISGDGPVQEALKSGDLMDRMRLVTPDDTGNFRSVIALAGRYRLRARWGAATAERLFEVGSSTTDLDLGDITLKSGSSLLGEIPGCHVGKATAIMVPDLSKPPTFDTLTTPIDIDGRFRIQGLLPGRWSILIQCEGKPVKTEPQVVTMPESGDAVVGFVRSQR